MIEVRSFSANDIEPVISYWFDKTAEEYEALSIEPKNLPDKQMLTKALVKEASAPAESRYLSIYRNARFIGVCVLNNFRANSADFHIHIFSQKDRQRGNGVRAIKLAIPIFLQRHSLKTIYSPVPVRNTFAVRLADHFGNLVSTDVVREEDASILRTGTIVKIFQLNTKHHAKPTRELPDSKQFLQADEIDE